MKPCNEHPMHINANTRVRWNAIRGLDFLRNVNGRAALDLASGMGYFSVRLAEGGAKVLASDIHESSLQYIQDAYGLETQKLDVEAEVYPQGPFDIVFLCEVLEHLKDPEAVLAKARSVLAPSGVLLVTTPALEGAFIHSAGKELGHHHGAEKHERDGFSREELHALFEKNGLTVAGHRYSIFYLAELFMQFTKLMYLRKNKKYEGQADILSATKSMPYAILRFVYPLLNAVFIAEEALLRSMGCKGHCHIIWGTRNE